MPTYRCTAACKDCGTFSNPRSHHASLSESSVLRAIDEAAEAGYVGVVFTGGEATLALDVVLAGLRRAKQYRMGTRLVTNGGWADSAESAHRTLRSLIDAGLDELNLSTGDQHVRFVAVTSVVRAACVALELGIRVVCVMIEVVDGASISSAHVAEDPAFKAAVDSRPTAHVQLVESPWMPTRADRVSNYPESMLLNRRTLASRSGCDSCLRTTTLQADGRITACCGLGIRTIPELQVGHIDSISLREADELASDDFLKRWIRLEGPEKILAWAARFDESIEWEDMYAHKCQACLRIYKDERVRQVIRDNHQEKMADVLLGEFLLSRFSPQPEEPFPSESPTT